MSSQNLEVIAWRSSFNTNVTRIDTEHKLFIMLMNSFKKALDTGRNEEELLRIIDELEKYAIFHFKSEENLMVSIGYPDYNNHCTEHHKLLESFFVSRYSSIGFTGFYRFLVEWFVEHTAVEDIKIKAYIEANQIDLTESCYNL
ncbi:bacteriohemerythrin [Carboxylicivirga marina]|uniref:Hemerythrin family protein n=1 Tax=Carboxylicivirga marina TaxID=2800988 RepID=A0ABS1HPA4_9BACT|nr:hemerythrin family protein [Carboxylicivirga marina]MBK3519367.1 hemerythrin family protein [Carboxylicivirga marina]